MCVISILILDGSLVATIRTAASDSEPLMSSVSVPEETRVRTTLACFLKTEIMPVMAWWSRGGDGGVIATRAQQVKRSKRTTENSFLIQGFFCLTVVNLFSSTALSPRLSSLLTAFLWDASGKGPSHNRSGLFRNLSS